MKEFIKFSMFMVFLFCVLFAILNAFYGERFSLDELVFCTFGVLILCGIAGGFEKLFTWWMK